LAAGLSDWLTNAFRFINQVSQAGSWQRKVKSKK
jgi:hypothetical protein